MNNVNEKWKRETRNMKPVIRNLPAKKYESGLRDHNCWSLITNCKLYLNCHTYFSFKYGTLSIKELFAEAKRCGVPKLALTDINYTCGYIEMLRICNECREEFDLELAVGIEFRRDDKLLYIAIARNNQGFEEINGYLSHYNNSKQPLLTKAPEFSHAYVVYPFSHPDPAALVKMNI